MTTTLIDLTGFDRIMDEVRIGPEPEMNNWLAKFGRDFARRNQAPPGGPPGKAGRFAITDTLTHLRPQAVGTDQREAALVGRAGAVAHRDGDAVWMRDKIFDARAEFKGDFQSSGDCGQQRRLQIAAMNYPIGRAVALFGAFAERHPHYLASACGAHHPQRRGCDGERPQTVLQSEGNQRARGVG